MRNSKISYKRLAPAICMLLLVMVYSCSETAEVTPAAKNILSGEIAGTAFTSTILAAAESEGFHSITGNVNVDANFQLFFRGNGLTNHPIATTGVFVETIDILGEISDSIISQASNPNFDTDSALTELTNFFSEKIDSIFADTTDIILQENEAFMFYIIEETIYYSNSGSLNINRLDEELYRIDGDFDIELMNLPGGTKELTGIIEDLEFVR